MIKNQLVIYRTFATHQYLFDIHETKEPIQLSVPSTTKIDHITSNYPFTITNHQIHINPIVLTKSTSSNAIDETEEKNVHKLIQNIEIIIKYPNIKWKSIYNFFKDTNTLICYASITNESHFDIDTKDVKIVFRSIDHDYDINQPKNLNIDIPTFHTKNIIQFDLKEIFDNPFKLSDHTNIEVWRHNVSCNEIFQHYILDDHQNYCDSFLIFRVPEIIFPGHLEIYHRTEQNDILCLGSTSIKLYQKDEKMKIHFPKNRLVKLKNTLVRKNHSFFIQKTQILVSSKIKKYTEDKAIIHFYIEKHKVKNPSKASSFEDDGYLVWEMICEDLESNFQLDFNIE